MGLLANVLPGFRNLRAPVVAGYFWVLVGWVALHDSFTAERRNAEIEDIVDLAASAGPVWTGVAVGTFAYLLGLISSDVSKAMVAFARSVRQARLELSTSTLRRERSRSARKHRPEPESVEYHETHHSGLSRWIGEHLELLGFEARKATRSATLALLDAVVAFPVTVLRTLLRDFARAAGLPGEIQFSLDKSDPVVRQLVEDRSRRTKEIITALAKSGSPDVGQKRTDAEIALERLTDELQRELDLPATLLVGNQPELFAEADRIRAESELRAAVVPPALGATALLCASSSVAWLVLLVPIVQLLVQAMRRDDEARRLIGSSLLFGSTESAAVRRFDTELDALANGE